MPGEFCSPYRYQAGGSLPANAPTYVERQADHDLWQALQAGDYCYVLNARQMGKSSLRARTMQRLRAEGVCCAAIELNGIGSQQISARQWYGGIIWELVSGLNLQVDRRQWLRDHEDLSPVQRLGQFIDSIVLPQTSEPIVLFFDEIDSILSLKFTTDEFFAWIRYCYERRASDRRYQRLTVVLLGVATPSDLIAKKPELTPFNIGQAIELREFQAEEITPLTTGFHDTKNPQFLVQTLLEWSGGQPFLTQKLCGLIRRAIDAPQSPWWHPETRLPVTPDRYPALIASCIQSQVIQDWETQDEPEHLRTIRDRLLYHRPLSYRPLSYRLLPSSAAAAPLLDLAQTLAHRGKLKIRQTPDHEALKLSGLVVARAGYWVIKNRIYQAVFTPAWIRQTLAALPPPPLVGVPRGQRAVSPRTTGLTTGLTTALVAGFILLLRSIGLFQSLELQSLDLLMRSRPLEGPDPRILLITITETDVQNQPLADRGAASLSDASLDHLRRKLIAARPRVIGIDLYREQAVDPAYPQLGQWLRSQGPSGPNLLGICSYGAPGVPPSPDLPRDHHGFNNVLGDRDGIVRRYPLAVGDPSPCRNGYALSWLLASRYLAAEGIHTTITPEGTLQLGPIIFQPLGSTVGGYHRLDNRGHQLLINYRATPQIATVVTLGEVLSDRFNPQLARDRLVLVGTSAPSFNDHHWLTPQVPSRDGVPTLTGSELQAHLISQLLSAVLDRRPLLWAWSEGGEVLWIMAWAIAGAGVGQMGCSRGRWFVLLGLGVAGVGLVSWGLLLVGGWVPLVPAGLALVGSSVGLRYLRYRVS